MAVVFEEKDWVKHIIAASGIFIGICIILGFIYQLRFFLGPHSSPTITCQNCITEGDNNFQQTIKVGSVVVLELPESLYSQKNLTILQNPANSIKKIGTAPPHQHGNWTIQYQALQKGYIDIIVKSNQATKPDYHSVLLIE